MMSTKSKLGIILSLIFITALVVGFAPAGRQTATAPLISIDIEALTNQIQETLSAQMSEQITALELRITELEKMLTTYEDRIGELEKLASIPTVTPAPIGTPTETLEPTRTPNPTGYDCTTELLSPYYYGQFNPESEFIFRTNITNTGSKTWGKEVTINWSEGLKAEVEEQYAYALPVSEVAPDDTFEITILMKAPSDKVNEGKYESYYVLNNGEEDFCEFSYTIYVP